MANRWEQAKDLFHGGVDGLRALLEDLLDLLGEVLLGLTACGLLALAWWGYQKSPYVTVPIVAGVLLFVGYGAVAFFRDIRGVRLVGRLGVTAILAAGAVALLSTYLPYCDCLN